jgi:hypothetical protein
MADGLNLDPWWDEPAYKAAQAQGTFSERGTFILNKLAQYNAVKLSTVIADLYRDEPPDPMDITKFQWQTILAYMGRERGGDQMRMGRVWR